MATRHQVRSAAISMLYAHEMGSFNDDFMAEFLDEQKIKNEQRAYAMDLIFGVLSRQSEIDKEINARLASFKLSELGTMERAILRLGAYEIIAKKCDARIAISEAVILASEFGADSAPKLVNGVLNNIYKGEGIVAEISDPAGCEAQNSDSEFSKKSENSENSKPEFFKKSENSENSKPEFSKKPKNSRSKNSKAEFYKNSKNSALKNSKNSKAEFYKKPSNTAKKDKK